MGRIEARMKRLDRLPVNLHTCLSGNPSLQKNNNPADGGGKEGEEGEL